MSRAEVLVRDMHRRPHRCLCPTRRRWVGYHEAPPVWGRWLRTRVLYPRLITLMWCWRQPRLTMWRRQARIGVAR